MQSASHRQPHGRTAAIDPHCAEALARLIKTLVRVQRVRRGGGSFASGTLAKDVFLHCLRLAFRGRVVVCERRCQRSCATCRDDLPRRFLGLSRVHPLPGDGSAPHYRLSRLPGLHRTSVASRCSLRRRGVEQHVGHRGGGRRASLARFRPAADSAAPMSAPDIHGVGVAGQIQVAAWSLPFTVGCQASARRWCCVRGQILSLDVARMTSW